MTIISAAVRATLEPCYAGRDQALASLPAAKGAFERGQQLKADTQEQLAVAKQALDDYQASQGRKLADRIIDGASVELLLVEPEGEALVLALATAQQRDDVAAQALTVLQATYAEALNAVTSAEAALASAVDQVLIKEAEEHAAEGIRCFERAALCVAKVRELAPDPIHTPVNLPRITSPMIERALALLPPPDDLHRSVALINGTDTVSVYRERRAALIRGDATERDTAQHQAA